MAALSREELIRLAKAGAGARVRELRAELDSIYATFPELRTGDAGRAVKTPGASKDAARAVVKRPWSAAEKKAVSERMKKYWAARKAASAKVKSAKAAAK
ncbi:MAG TPA: hypothetical protein VM032_04910 [Vicinamibacterales bacterium]|nr:hypothetical protein [Vicinamibacterales bacterium]